MNRRQALRTHSTEAAPCERRRRQQRRQQRCLPASYGRPDQPVLRRAASHGAQRYEPAEGRLAHGRGLAGATRALTCFQSGDC